MPDTHQPVLSDVTLARRMLKNHGIVLLAEYDALTSPDQEGQEFDLAHAAETILFDNADFRKAVAALNRQAITLVAAELRRRQQRATAGLS